MAIAELVALADGDLADAERDLADARAVQCEHAGSADVDAAQIERLVGIRDAIASRVAEASDLEEVRTALHQTYDHFTLRVYDMFDETGLVASNAEFYLEPTLRSEVLSELARVWAEELTELDDKRTASAEVTKLRLRPDIGHSS